MTDSRSPDAAVAARPPAGQPPGSGFAIRAVDPGAPFRWLASGWGDFRATGFRGAVYGAVFALMG